MLTLRVRVTAVTEQWFRLRKNLRVQLASAHSACPRQLGHSHIPLNPINCNASFAIATESVFFRAAIEVTTLPLWLPEFLQVAGIIPWHSSPLRDSVSGSAHGRECIAICSGQGSGADDKGNWLIVSVLRLCSSLQSLEVHQVQWTPF